MNRLMKGLAWFITGMLACFTISASAAPAPPPGDPQAWQSYGKGLIAMHDGHPDQAIAPFTDAIKHMPDGRFYLARAAALTLTHHFDEALTDLSHARVSRSREPTLWHYCIWAMSGKGALGSWFSGIPGHYIQGGDDYTTAYASFIYYEMAMPYRKARRNHGDLEAPALEAATRKASRWFANHELGTREMADFDLRWTQSLIQDGELPEASRIIAIAESVYPYEAWTRYLSGIIWLRLGRPATARRDFTVALTMQTNMADAYRGRALAAAAMGDARRAEADLRSAAKYRPKDPNHVARQVKETLASTVETEDPQTLAHRLDSAALAGDAIPKLLPIAVALQKAAGASALRYGEVYQDHLRRLEDAIRAKPRDADARVAEGRYLLQESVERGARVEPRQGLVAYRFQYSSGFEIRRAVGVLKSALAIEPRNVGALTQLADAYDRLGEGETAKHYIDQVMQRVGAGNAQAIRLLAEYRSRQVGALMMRATALRMPRHSSSVHYEDRSDGVYKVTTTYTYQPSASNLAEANELQAQAQRLAGQTKEIMEKAIHLTGHTLEGMLLQSFYQNWFGSRRKALEVLEKAVQRYPDQIKAYDQLAQYERFLGFGDAAIRTELAGTRLYQTTDWPLLGLVWEHIQNKGWAGVKSDILQARAADPRDARATAYLAAAEAADGNHSAALGYEREAAALELARIRLDDQGAGRRLPRPAAGMALAMEELDRLGRAANQAGHSKAALAYYRESASLADRFGPGGAAEPMFHAMIPDPNTPEGPAPAPVNGATLASEAYVASGKILKAMGDTQEAMKEFARAAKLATPRNPDIPMIGNGRGDNNFGDVAKGASAEALIELAKARMQAGDYKAALDLLQRAGQAHPDRSLRPELNKLNLEAVQHLNDQLGRQRDEQQQSRQQATLQKVKGYEQHEAAKQQAYENGATLDTDLVGTWVSDPAYPMMGGRVTLTISADGAYTWVQGNTHDTGTIRATNSTVTMTTGKGRRVTGAFRLTGLAPSTFGPKGPHLQLAFSSGQQFFLTRSQ